MSQDLQTVEKSLSILRRPTLTKGQRILLSIITDKIHSGASITLEETKNIWITAVCREIREGLPYYYDYYKETIINSDGNKVWRGGYSLMSDWQITQRSLMWLTSSIGSLVMKGFLKVIPRIELKTLTDN